VSLVGHVDCAGGGQVWVDGHTLFVGHMSPPFGTSIHDVSDPRHPRLLAEIPMPRGWHSHKVRARGGLMLVNHERQGSEGAAEFGGGLGIYDVADPANPRLICKWPTPGKGVHRFDFDGRFAYLSASAEGFVGNIVVILDLDRPDRPQEVGRWWMAGQWQAGGEDSLAQDAVPPRCHHPLRMGERLHVSYWHHGFFILDVSDLSAPRALGHAGSQPGFAHPTHTCLPFPQMLKGRRVMVVADEDVAKRHPAPPAFAWIYDITDERFPIPIATWQVAGLDPDGAPQPPLTGCHQPSERLAGTVIPFAWFAQGLRLVDIADPFAPREVGHFLPDPPAGADRVSSNDVTIDDRGLIYLVDRIRGVDILETSAL